MIVKTNSAGKALPILTTPAVSTNILIGKQAIDASGNLLTGNMADNGAINTTLTTSGQQYTIPVGYHNGSGIVTAPTFSQIAVGNIMIPSRYNEMQWSIVCGFQPTEVSMWLVGNVDVLNSSGKLFLTGHVGASGTGYEYFTNGAAKIDTYYPYTCITKNSTGFVWKSSSSTQSILYQNGYYRWCAVK